MRFLRMAACCNYTKTIIHLRLSEYRGIKTSTSSRFLFANVRFAFGELLLNISNQSFIFSRYLQLLKMNRLIQNADLNCVKFTLNMHTSFGKIIDYEYLFVCQYDSSYKCGIYFLCVLAVKIKF